MSAPPEVYAVTGGCTRKKTENGISKDFGVVFNEVYEFVDLGACEASIGIGGAVVERDSAGGGIAEGGAGEDDVGDISGNFIIGLRGGNSGGLKSA